MQAIQIDPGVFPAHAGMIPDDLSERDHLIGFPRSRGDDPFLDTGRNPTRKFSPLTRG